MLTDIVVVYSSQNYQLVKLPPNLPNTYSYGYDFGLIYQRKISQQYPCHPISWPLLSHNRIDHCINNTDLSTALCLKARQVCQGNTQWICSRFLALNTNRSLADNTGHLAGCWRWSPSPVPKILELNQPLSKETVWFSRRSVADNTFGDIQSLDSKPLTQLLLGCPRIKNILILNNPFLVDRKQLGSL